MIICINFLVRNCNSQFDFPVTLPHGQDVDVRIEAEAERLSFISEGGLYLCSVMVPGPHHSTGIGRTNDMTTVVTGLGPDAGYWLGVRPSLLVGKVVDDLTSGRVHHLDAAVQEADTDIRTVLSIPQTEYLSTTLDSIEDPDVAVSHRTAIIGSTQERARAPRMFRADTGVPAAHTAALPGLTS